MSSSSVEDRKKQTKLWKYGYLLIKSQFCCSLAALNFDTLFGACWGRAPSGATSSCFLSSIVGRAGGVMVRWGTAEGIGSFSTTVPENAWRGEKEKQREKKQVSNWYFMTDHFHLTETGHRGKV